MEEGKCEGDGAVAAVNTSQSTGQRTPAERHITIEWTWSRSWWMATGWCSSGLARKRADAQTNGAGGGGGIGPPTMVVDVGGVGEACHVE
jgi:hypothetical protein